MIITIMHNYYVAIIILLFRGTTNTAFVNGVKPPHKDTRMSTIELVGSTVSFW